MWGLFAIATIVGVVFLFLPGYLFLRAGRLSSWLSLGCAPLISVACYSVLCVAFDIAGVSCSWYSVFLPVLAVSALAYGVSRFVAGVCPAELKRRDAVVMGVYVIIGIAVTCGMYMCQLTSPEAFIQSWDNVHHLDAIRGFVDSGRWSSLGTSLYLGNDASIDPFVEGAFYPSAWYAFAAMVAGLFDLSAPYAISVVNFVIIAIAFPLSTHAFLRAVFGDDIRTVTAGSLFVLANASCPWVMLRWGPLYPNIMANCLLPGLMGAFVLLLSQTLGAHRRVSLCAVLLVGVLSYVFIQPNGVFTAVVLLAPYLVVRVFSMARGSTWACERGSGFAWSFGLVCSALAVIVVIAFWMFAFNAPFMQAVVNYRWPYDTEFADALMDVVTQRFHTAALSIGCALMLGAGIVSALVRKRHRWLIASWLLSCTIYVICVSVGGEWHQLAAGFWYTDVPRVAAFAAFSAVPLQAIGLAEVVSLAVRPLASRRYGELAAGMAMTAIVGIMLFAPIDATESTDVGSRHFTNANALSAEAAFISWDYRSDDPRIYDEAERAFVREALSIMPEGSLVINEPNDGSAYAYGVDGLRTYYRYWRGYGDPSEGEKPESALIRDHLCDIVANEDVKKAIDDIGARYVIQLDRGEPNWNYMMWLYGDGELWRGIDGVNEETPGFELLLSRDDMRLYQIVEK